MVCSTASIMATNDILLGWCPASTCRKLSAWLQAHSTLAAVSKLDLCRAEDPSFYSEEQLRAVLQLPVLQLRNLQELSLCDFQVVPYSSSSSSSSSVADQPEEAVFNPALAALTSLHLAGCRMNLAGLGSLTGLQVLHIRQYGATKDWEKANAHVFAEALPQLQQLTSLKLEYSAACDSVLLNIGSCTRLAQLSVQGSCWSARGLQQLPASLQQLELCWEAFSSQPAPPEVTINASTTPRFCQLSALQAITVHDVKVFDTTVLGGLSSITSLSLRTEQFTASPGQYRFQALAEHKLPHLVELAVS